MVDVRDLVKGEPDVDGDAEGCIKETDVDGHAQIVVESDIWGIVVLPPV